MSSNVTISCILDTNNPAAPLGFEAWVDNHKFCDMDQVESKQQVFFELPNDDGEHELKFILKNKTAEHTKIDADNNIVSDARLTIADVAVDGIILGNIVTELATYTHDFNGTQPPIQTKFYGEIGCNGTVSLKFTTPIYLWLLEHM